MTHNIFKLNFRKWGFEIRKPFSRGLDAEYNLVFWIFNAYREYFILCFMCKNMRRQKNFGTESSCWSGFYSTYFVLRVSIGSFAWKSQSRRIKYMTLKIKKYEFIYSIVKMFIRLLLLLFIYIMIHTFLYFTV